METLYKGFLVDRSLAAHDPHFAGGCTSCHKGNDAEFDKEKAHHGLVRRPSDDPKTCGACHEDIAKKYAQSLHYTTQGLRTGVLGRFSADEITLFDEKVFGRSCKSCHASCGDCHVKSPMVGGVNLGLLGSHRFVKKNEGKTCALCHGGRVYPEFTGEYGGRADVHHQKGMTCVNCHPGSQMHGEGRAVKTRHDVSGKPACRACHKTGTEGTQMARTAHAQHTNRVSCSACHSAAPYRNCSGCHLGKGATAQPAFALGRDPRNPKTVTTLRLVPTVKDTFAKTGIKMERFDALPNYWATTPHNIRKITDRTRECGACHGDDSLFLNRAKLADRGSRKNEELLYTPKPLTK